MKKNYTCIIGLNYEQSLNKVATMCKKTKENRAFSDKIIRRDEENV